MVDTYGRWTYEPNTPEEKKCDCDRIADKILADGYKPKTNIENITLMAISHFETDCEFTGEEFTVEGAIEFVEASGGWNEFDYEC